MSDIIFAAGEAEAFSFTGNSFTGTTANEVDLTYARCSFGPQDLAATHTGVFSKDVDDLWLHFEVNIETLDSQADHELVTIIGNSQSLLQIKGSNGVLSFEYYNGVDFTSIVSSLNILADELTEIDIHCKIHDSDGEIAIYIGGVFQGKIIGNTIFSPQLTVDSFTFGAVRSGGQSLGRCLFSQVIGREQVSTIGSKLYTMNLDGNGTSSGFTGDVTDIDELNIDDADSISTSTADVVSTFTTNDLPTLAANENIVALVTNARVRNTASSPQNAQFATRSGGTDFFSSNVSGLGLGYGQFTNIEHVDPDTGLVWTESKVNAVEVGIKSIT